MLISLKKGASAFSVAAVILGALGLPAKAQQSAFDGRCDAERFEIPQDLFEIGIEVSLAESIARRCDAFEFRTEFFHPEATAIVNRMFAAGLDTDCMDELPEAERRRMIARSITRNEIEETDQLSFCAAGHRNYEQDTLLGQHLRLLHGAGS